MYKQMPTEKLITRHNANNTSYHNWIKIDEVLFDRAEKGDEKAIQHYINLREK